MTPHGAAAAHRLFSLNLSGCHGIEFILDRLPHLRAKALEDLALELHEPGHLGRQGRSLAWGRGEIALAELGRSALLWRFWRPALVGRGRGGGDADPRNQAADGAEQPHRKVERLARGRVPPERRARRREGISRSCSRRRL